MFHSFFDSHMYRSMRSLARGIYSSAGFFLILFSLFHIGTSLYTSSLAEKSSIALQNGIEKELLNLKVQGDEIAANPNVIEYLLNNDREKLTEYIKKEEKSRSLGSIAVTNDAGTVVSRTRNLGVQGDNVFLTFPEGRAVAKGESVQSVAQSVFNPTQIRLSTGRPIKKDGEMIGALFTNRLLDDSFAEYFRNTYLPPESEVLFYNKQYGIYGGSITDPEQRELVSSYFNSGSEWIQNGGSGRTVSFKTGNYFFVENVVFPGLEESTAGALILVPRAYISSSVNVALSLVILIIFLVTSLYYHAKIRGREHGWRYYTALSVVSIPVFFTVLVLLSLQNKSFLQLKSIPYTLYNSTMRFQPEWGIYDKDFEQKFSIIVDTGDESINAAQFSIEYDPSQVEIKEIDTSSSSCSYFIENKISKADGRANLSCIILNSGIGKRSLTIADVVVVPLKTGTFKLSFNKDGTKVLANDGLGTNVLRMAQSGSYRVDDFDPALSGISKENNEKSDLRSFVVFSPTHPNQSRWYNTQTARFVWRGKSNEVYSYVFDTNSGTIPGKDKVLQGTQVDIPIPGDGIFYFHLGLASGGSVAHYKIQSDTTPPTIVSMKLSSNTIYAGDVARFFFEAVDIASGIQRNYYVDLGNHLFLPIGSQLFVPFQKTGNQKLTLRVYDNAGNYSEKTQIIHVEKPNP